MTIDRAVAEYGYIALFVGSLLEGETILLLAGFAAHQQRLWMPAVILTAFLGGTLGDQVFFWIGRRGGLALLQRWPAVQRQAGRLGPLLRRHDAWFVVGIRFAYGFRIAGPIAMGACDIKPGRFLLFNILGAAIWAVVVSGAGYLFSEALHAVLGELGRFEDVAALAVVVISLVWAALKAWRQHSKRSAKKWTG
jgi:membrane protein DedA with SNARE-associated domain